MTRQPSYRRGATAGSFDPVHFGHVAMIATAATMVDELYVLVATNPDKGYLLSQDDRIKLTTQALSHLDNVHVVPSTEAWLVDSAHNLGATVLFKGLRDHVDLAYEQRMQHVNRLRQPDISTVYLCAAAEYQNVSSTTVRQLLNMPAAGDILASMVPSTVLEHFNVSSWLT